MRPSFVVLAPSVVLAPLVAALLVANVPRAQAVDLGASAAGADAGRPERTVESDRNHNRSAASHSRGNVIEEFSSERTARGTSLTIRLQQPLALAPRSHEMANPPRVVFDVPAEAGGYGNEALSLIDGPLRTVAVTPVGDGSQIVLTLRQSMAHQIALEGAAIQIRLDEFAAPAAELRGADDDAPVPALARAPQLHEPLLLAVNAAPHGDPAAAHRTLLDGSPTTLVDSAAPDLAVGRPVSAQSNEAALGADAIAAPSAIAQGDSHGAAPSPAQRDRWELRASDVKLSSALERWARDAGWRMNWEAERDFDLVLQASFGGTFEQALNAVLRAYVISDFPLQACLHEDHDGNRAVRIFRYGEHKTCD